VQGLGDAARFDPLGSERSDETFSHLFVIRAALLKRSTFPYGQPRDPNEAQSS